MKRKWVLVALIVALAFGAIGYYLTPKYTAIDTWTAYLNPNDIQWAQASDGYGVEEITYSFSEEEYHRLVALIGGITEDNVSRSRKDASAFTDQRLALYDGTLWVFHCTESGWLSLMFEDHQTAEKFGADSCLHIDYPELYQYIQDILQPKG